MRLFTILYFTLDSCRTWSMHAEARKQKNDSNSLANSFNVGKNSPFKYEVSRGRHVRVLGSK